MTVLLILLILKDLLFPVPFQPCAEAIFRKPTHRKNRTAQGSSRDVGGDTDALLDNETLS